MAHHGNHDQVVRVEGFVAPGFTAVEEAFAANFTERDEIGASLCVTHHGTTVVDLWGGLADADSGRPWQRSTLVNHYSVGKALVACLVLRHLDTGLLQLDQPLTSIWPSLAAPGVTVRHALTHTAGLPAIAQPLRDDDLWSWDRMVDALAATPPWHPPGARVIYHTNTYGHLVGEIARRAGGEPPGAQLARLAGELGADVHLGLSDGDLDRCATTVLDWPAPPSAPPGLATREADMIRRSYANPPAYSSFGVVNTRAWRQAQIPGTNGHSTASGLATFYGALLQPGRVVHPDLLARATSVQAEGDCPILGERAAFGLGFVPTSARRPLGPNAGAFGHFGTGGSVGFADPVADVAFGYVMNRVRPGWQSRRNRALIDTFYACLPG